MSPISQDTKLQEMSMQWLDLARTAHFIGWKRKDVQEAPNRTILQAVVRTFNQAQGDHYNEELDSLALESEKYRLKFTCSKLNVKPATVALLEEKGVDGGKYEERKTGNNMLFFFCTSKALGKKREIVVLSTGHAWGVVRKCIYVDHPSTLAQRILDPENITKITRFSLLGPNLKETLLNPTSFQLYKTSSLYYLVESICCLVKSNSSLLTLPAFAKGAAPRMTLTTGGLLRLHYRFSLQHYPALLTLFHEYIYGKPTYNTSGEPEKGDSRFEFLNYIHPAGLPSSELDSALVANLLEQHQKGEPFTIVLRHKELETFLQAESFEIQVAPGGRFRPLPPRPPTLAEVVELMPSRREKLPTLLRQCQIRFQDSQTHKLVKAFLIECLEGELCHEGKGYFKIRGMWYQLNLDYPALVQEDFSALIRDVLLTEGEGILPNKWTGNMGQNVLTQELATKARGTGAGVRAFMKKLVEAKVRYLEPSGKINQDYLVGEILEVKEVAENTALIEQELAKTSSRSFEKRLKALLPAESEKILEELKKERSIVVVKSKKKWVHNPLTYPLRKELGDKERGFAQLLETLYERRGKQKEEAYNRSYLYDRMNKRRYFGPDRGYLVFDQMTPLNIEMCDLVYYTPKATYLYHVKEKFGQDTRIACDQILNGAKMLRSALSTHQPQDYLDMLWHEGMKIRQSEGWRAMMKRQLSHLGKRPFLEIFRNRKIVFVYAYLAKGGKTLQRDAETPTMLPVSQIPPEVHNSRYVDSKNRLTGAFYETSLETFTLEGVGAERCKEIYRELSKFKSASNSTLAKLDLVRLDQELRSLNFSFKMCEIEQADSPIFFTPPPTISESEEAFSESETEEEVETLTGLPNILNSCYMNASIQALTYLEPILVELEAKRERKGIPKCLVQAIEKRDCRSLATLREVIFQDKIYPMEEIHAQQDPLPLLGKVFEALEWAPMEIYTAFFYDLPGGGRKQHTSPKTFSPYLSLMIEPGKTFQQLFSDYFAKEEIDDPENPLKPEQYPDYVFQNYALAQRIAQPPELLVVHLKRFRQEGTKISDSIPFPEDFRVTLKQRRNDPVTTYEIVSIINHHGSMVAGGHYTADVRDLTVDEERWLHCDDSRMSVSKPQNPDEEAYICFLRKL